jgi:molybdopterin-guanine dinucleotide biosynthesis protein B
MHVVGRMNHGKTPLVVVLIQVLTRQGLLIGTIKHAHHRHELDTPGNAL